MLRNVQFNYPQAAVTEVTQNSFHNYFGGSEILVAGKYNASILENIQSFITATSVTLDLQFLKTSTGSPTYWLSHILYSEKLVSRKKGIWKGNAIG